MRILMSYMLRVLSWEDVILHRLSEHESEEDRWPTTGGVKQPFMYIAFAIAWKHWHQPLDLAIHDVLKMMIGYEN